MRLARIDFSQSRALRNEYAKLYGKRTEERLSPLNVKVPISISCAAILTVGVVPVATITTIKEFPSPGRLVSHVLEEARVELIVQHEVPAGWQPLVD